MAKLESKLSIIYVYIYIYVCVCVNVLGILWMGKLFDGRAVSLAFE